MVTTEHVVSLWLKTKTRAKQTNKQASKTLKRCKEKCKNQSSNDTKTNENDNIIVRNSVSPSGCRTFCTS